MSSSEFPDLVRSLRLDRSLSQRELGELIGVSHGAISEWERGKNGPENRSRAEALDLALEAHGVVLAAAGYLPDGANPLDALNARIAALEALLLQEATDPAGTQRKQRPR